VKIAGLDGKIVVGKSVDVSERFSDDVKSGAFITAALKSSKKCPICCGYLDPEKSISYDHIVRVRDGGNGHVGNCQLTHPYCNQSVKQ
jgi:HNH endonuclease